jgi:hypothetical protein
VSKARSLSSVKQLECVLEKNKSNGQTKRREKIIGIFNENVIDKN